MDNNFEPTNQNDTSKNASNSGFDDLLSQPFGETTESTTESNEITQEMSQSTYENLDEDSQKRAVALSEEIDGSDISSVIHYGASAQEKISDFSQNVLDKVQTQDTGEIGNTLNDLMFQLKEADPKDLSAESKNIFQKMFSKINRSIYETTAKYQKIGASVNKIAQKLDKEKDDLMEDNEMLSGLYDQNLEYYKALNVYIAAGELKIDDIIQNDLPEAQQLAAESSDQMTIQKVNDLNQFQDRLEKRVHDLKIARQLTIQQAPQIRLIQNTNQALAEKIQTSVNTAIPLWKNQVVIALTLLRQKEAITAQRQVSDTTNELLEKNSEMLKQSSIETARENERGVVDIETLEKTQTNLLETLQETLDIQRTGRENRLAAEKQLSTMEEQLKDQLLQLTNKENNS